MLTLCAPLVLAVSVSAALPDDPLPDDPLAGVHELSSRVRNVLASNNQELPLDASDELVRLAVDALLADNKEAAPKPTYDRVLAAYEAGTHPLLCGRDESGLPPEPSAVLSSSPAPYPTGPSEIADVQELMQRVVVGLEKALRRERQRRCRAEKRLDRALRRAEVAEQQLARLSSSSASSTSYLPTARPVRPARRSVGRRRPRSVKSRR